MEENRWFALRARDGRRAGRPAHRRADAGARRALRALVAELEPVAERLGCGAELATVEALGADPGAARQRRAFAAGGLRGVAAYLAGAYVPSAEPEPLAVR